MAVEFTPWGDESQKQKTRRLQTTLLCEGIAISFAIIVLGVVVAIPSVHTGLGIVVFVVFRYIWDPIAKRVRIRRLFAPEEGEYAARLIVRIIDGNVGAGTLSTDEGVARIESGVLHYRSPRLKATFARGDFIAAKATSDDGEVNLIPLSNRWLQYAVNIDIPRKARSEVFSTFESSDQSGSVVPSPLVTPGVGVGVQLVALVFATVSIPWLAIAAAMIYNRDPTVFIGMSVWASTAVIALVIAIRLQRQHRAWLSKASERVQSFALPNPRASAE